MYYKGSALKTQKLTLKDVLQGIVEFFGFAAFVVCIPMFIYLIG